MSVTSRYIKDFELLFVPIKTSELQERARTGGLRHCQFRSLCWRYFLHCLSGQCDNWVSHCEKSRSRYNEIKQRHLKARQLEERSQLTDTAVAAAAASIGGGGGAPSHQFGSKQLSREAELLRKELEEEQRYLRAVNFCDHKNVFRTIERDVVRTFPDMEFFKQAEMQAILSNVLFNFACEYPSISYKQGMHELLAILLYVLHTDAHNCLINHKGGYANHTIATLLDLNYLEHDVFFLFAALMKSIESWYQNDEVLILKSQPNAAPDRPSANHNNKHPYNQQHSTSANRQQVSSVLANKLSMISVNILRSHDMELSNHLEALQIAPQIYGIRWMRLLFGREFEFLDLLTVWDAMICDREPMALMDFIFASMLISMREQLVNGDYTDCLNNLMRHQFKDVQFIIKMAFHLRDANNYPRPIKQQISQELHQLKTILPYLPRRTRTNNNQTATSVPHSNKKYTPKSNDDLHLIVDYCWRLLSQQIESLQRCLPREKSLHSEDEIFVAVAQLKKVRDVLKGSLRLEDELDSSPGGGGGGGSSSSRTT